MRDKRAVSRLVQDEYDRFVTLCVVVVDSAYNNYLYLPGLPALLGGEPARELGREGEPLLLLPLLTL